MTSRITSATITSAFRVAVIGTGGIAEQHLAFLAASPLTEIVGLCDLSPATVRFYAERYGVTYWTTDVAALLNDSHPDVVHVLTPPSTHVALAEQCVRAGAHVVCEKPIGLSYRDVDQLILVAEAQDRLVTENHNYLFNSGASRLVRLAESDALGEIVEVDVRIAQNVRDDTIVADPRFPHPLHQLPAGVIHDVLTHLVYLGLAFVPGPFDRVAAAWRNDVGDDLFRYDSLDAIAIAGSQHLRLGFSASIQPRHLTIRVGGTRGHSEAELLQPSGRSNLLRSVGPQLSSTVNHMVNGAGLVAASARNLVNKLTKIETTYHGLHRYLDATYGALAARSPMPVTHKKIRETARFIDDLLAPDNAL